MDCAWVRDQGTIDPGVVLFLFQSLGLSARRGGDDAYKQSGLLGISGISSDMRDLLGRAEPEARLAVDYFVYRTAKEIGSMAAVLGESRTRLYRGHRGKLAGNPQANLRAFEWLGVELDRQANADRGPTNSVPNSKVSAWVIPTNEELMIVQHTGRLLGLT